MPIRHLSQKTLIVLSAVMVAIVGLLIVGGVFLAEKYRIQFAENREGEFAPPTVAEKRQVKRVLLKRTAEDGSTEVLEVLGNGQVNLYDENMVKKKGGIQGFTKVNEFLDRLNREYDSLGDLVTGNGNYQLIIETNLGTKTVTVVDGGGNVPGSTPLPGGGGIGDIIDDLEDIVDEIVNPGPTPTPQATYPPTTAMPSASPLPPGVTPSPASPGPTPTRAPGQPTPIPEYMLKPPFNCDDYYRSGKPLSISTFFCGLNLDKPR